MKTISNILLIIMALSLVSLFGCSVSKQTASQKETQVMEVACGQCMFSLPEKGCNLAVRIKDKAYFVDGSHIDSHGDAHAADGMCNAIRKASVKGKLVNNRFQAESIELLPVKE